MISKRIKQSFFAALLMAALAFVSSGYAEPVSTFEEFKTALSSPTITGIEVSSDIVAGVGVGALGAQTSNDLTINGNNFIVNGNENGGMTATNNVSIANVEMSSFSFTNYATGGAIRVAPNTGNLTVQNSTFTYNAMPEGISGAIHVSGTANISDSEFSNNSAKWGGAMYAGTSSNLTVSNTRFINNEAHSSIGALGVFKDANLSDVTFTGNVATSTNNLDGSGAIFFGALANANIDRGAFENNTSATNAGAIGTRTDVDQYGNKIDLSNAKLDITNSTFTGNTAAISGGAINNYFYNSNTAAGSVYVGNSAFNTNSANMGGAIYNRGEIDKLGNVASMSIDGSTFTGNNATTKGGAIYNDGTMTISNSLFDSNTSAQGGAIVVASTGNLTVQGSTFTHNASANGISGAIHVSGTANISDSEFSNNSAKWGGAMYAGTSSNLTVSNTRFINNEAHSSIGALGVFKDANLSDVTFTGNVATSTNNLDGSGAIFFGALANANIDRGAFENNTSATNAGAIGTRTDVDQYGNKIDLSNAKLDITNSTFTGNTAAISGGAINNYFYNSNTAAGSVYVGNSAFNTNSANMGGAIYNRGEIDKLGNVASMSIDGSTFTGNNATTKGGAIYNDGTMTISDSLFDSNTSAQGGAIVVASTGNLTVQGSTFTHNASTGWSGAMHVSGTANISDSDFSNNNARWAGAIAAGTSSDITITNTSFANNTAEEIGALGIFKNAVLNNVTFTGNTATSADDADPLQAGSGAIFFGSEATATIDNGTFTNNTSATSGGAIGTRRSAVGNNTAATLDITNSTFTKNTAATRGGAIDNYFYNSTTADGSVYVASSTFTENKADQGGAIYNHGEIGVGTKEATILIENSTFSDNIANQGAAIYNAGTLNIGENVQFISNFSKQEGGAIYNAADAKINFNAATVFANNTASGLLNDIYNDGEISFFSGTTAMTGGILGAGTTNVDGAILNFGNNATLKQDTLNISANSEVSVNANNFVINSGVSNNGLLAFYTGAAILASDITGTTGTTTLNNTNITVDSAIIEQAELNISADSSLISNADNLTIGNGIANEGKLTFIGGTNNNAINGNGNLAIEGNVTNANNSTISQNKIEILADTSVFSAKASDLAAASGIVNFGTLQFNSGATDDINGNAISGTGALIIDNATSVNNEGTIKQGTITIADAGSALESNINNITAIDKIQNEGGLLLTGAGTNNNMIDGAGNLVIDGAIENVLGTTINQSSIEIKDTAALTSFATHITTTGDGILNNGTLTFTGGINTNTIDAAENSGTLFVTGDLKNEAAITQNTINVESNLFENVSGNTITAQTLNADTTFITDAYDLNINEIALANDATLLLIDQDRLEDIILNANINGDGSLIKERDGIVTLNGNNQYTGSTTISDGALRIGLAENISDGNTKTIYMDGGKLITTADMDLNSQIVGTYKDGAANNVNIETEAGTTVLTTNSKIHGEGNLIKTGNGTLDLQMLSNSYSGNTEVQSGTLIGTTKNINGILSGTGSSNLDSFVFYDADSDVVLNEVDAANYIGTFNKIGSSTMTVVNNFQAFDANILSGTFVINNDLTMGGSGNNFTVDNNMIVSNALLKGYGDISVNQLIIGDGATFAPGNSTTTFKVTGNLAFEGNGEYDVEFGQFDMDRAGHYNDNTTVSGTVTISEDARITLNNLEGKYYVHETIDLINAGFLANGYEYKDVNVVFNDNDARELRPGYDTRISTRVYTENNTLKLALERKMSEYGITEEFERSHNEQQAATAIDNISTGNGGDITKPLDVLEHFFYYKDPVTGGANIPKLRASLNDIAGVIHANSTMLTFTNAKIEHVYDKVQKRSVDLYPCTKLHNKVWAQYYYNAYNVDENENSPLFDSSVNGFLVGFDMISAKNWTMGITAGYGTSEMKQFTDKTTMNDINLGFYSGYETDSWLFKGMLLGGYEQYKTDRSINFMNRIANSEYNGFGLALDLEAAYKIALNDNSDSIHKLTFKPFIGITGNYINREGFEEKGAGSLNLKVEGYDNLAAQARLGVGINGKVNKFGWYAKAGVRHFLTDDYNEIESSLLDYQDLTKMTIKSAELGNLSYDGGLGADYELSDAWTVFANGLVSFADKSNNYYGNIGLMYKFGCINNQAKTSAEDASLRRQLQAKDRELSEAREREKELQNRIQKYEANIISAEKAQQMKQKTFKTVRLEERPTFIFGTNELTDRGRESLRQLAKELEQYPDAEVLIEGHTDSMGSEAINQKISESRASAVATALKRDFNVPNDISVIGKGKSEPIASNDTPEGRAENRRVEFIITTNE